MEILFRGKRTDTGEWMYGFYGHKPNGNEVEEHFIMEWCFNAASDSIYTYFRDVPVIPETVGQYTGIDDRNGVKIFDGDICKMHYFFENHVGFGVFEDEAEITCRVTIAPFGLRFEGEGMSGYLYEYVAEPGEELEVIGNIHDNPELLDE